MNRDHSDFKPPQGVPETYCADGQAGQPEAHGTKKHRPQTWWELQVCSFPLKCVMFTMDACLVPRRLVGMERAPQPLGCAGQPILHPGDQAGRAMDDLARRCSKPCQGSSCTSARAVDRTPRQASYSRMLNTDMAQVLHHRRRTQSRVISPHQPYRPSVQSSKKLWQLLFRVLDVFLVVWQCSRWTRCSRDFPIKR